MKKEQKIKIIKWSTVALLVPILGQFFVEGWNWGPGDFVFAWVFFNLLGFTYVFVRNKISHPTIKILSGVGVILVFVSIWVLLATG